MVRHGHLRPPPSHEVLLLPSPSLQVTLKGGRQLLGDFQCLDKQGNLILGNTVETVAASKAGGKPEERGLGTVLVPRHQQDKVELQVRCAALCCAAAH